MVPITACKILNLPGYLLGCVTVPYDGLDAHSRAHRTDGVQLFDVQVQIHFFEL